MKTVINLTKPEGKILVKSHRGTHVIYQSTITRLIADGKYTDIYLKDGQRITSCDSLGQIEKLLDSNCFLRIHRSSIINLCELKVHSDSRQGHVEISDGSILSVAQRRRRDLLVRLHGQTAA